jgi:hypothetical protein
LTYTKYIHHTLAIRQVTQENLKGKNSGIDKKMVTLRPQKRKMAVKREKNFEFIFFQRILTLKLTITFSTIVTTFNIFMFTTIYRLAV